MKHTAADEGDKVKSGQRFASLSMSQLYPLQKKNYNDIGIKLTKIKERERSQVTWDYKLKKWDLNDKDSELVMSWKKTGFRLLV